MPSHFFGPFSGSYCIIVESRSLLSCYLKFEECFDFTGPKLYLIFMKAKNRKCGWRVWSVDNGKIWLSSSEMTWLRLHFMWSFLADVCGMEWRWERQEMEKPAIVSRLLAPAWEMTQPFRLLFLALEKKSGKGVLFATVSLWMTCPNRSDKK